MAVCVFVSISYDAMDWSAVFDFAFPGHTQMMFHVIHVDFSSAMY